LGASEYPATFSLIHCAVRYLGELTRAITRLSSRSAFAVATPSSLSHDLTSPDHTGATDRTKQSATTFIISEVSDI